MSTKERRERIAIVRQEGWDAYYANRHVQTNPYPTHDMDHHQWANGYYAATEADEDMEALHG